MSKLIIGLGNPGAEYCRTRHNVGFMIIDYLYSKYYFDSIGLKKNANMLCCGFFCGDFFGKNCILAKPSTYMNLSGNCVQKIMNYYKINPKDLVVIHDDADLDFGNIKISQSRNSAGHNGVKSINSVISENYNRIRIGIGRPDNNKFDLSDFVLSNFSNDEYEKMNNNIANEAVSLLEQIISNN